MLPGPGRVTCCLSAGRWQAVGPGGQPRQCLHWDKRRPHRCPSSRACAAPGQGKGLTRSRGPNGVEE